MAINKTTSFIVFAMMLVMCVGNCAAGLVRSTPSVTATVDSTESTSERVFDFAVASTRDSASWSAFGRRWTVSLALSEILMEDNTDYYQGSLEGDANAVVSFALLPGTGLSGMIMTDSDTYWLRATPIPEHAHSTDEDKLGIFMHREVETLAILPPQLSEPLVDDHHDVATEERSIETRAISTYKAAVFYDQKWALASNNPWSSQANTMGLLNDVNAIYKAAGLGQFTFKYMKQVSNSKTTLNDMLSFFSDTASKSIAAISDKTYTNYLWLVGSNVGGLAYVGTSCQANSAQNRKTAVAGLVSYSRLWTVKTIAHELGHNRGANHQFTNACTATVSTNCQCSVMSYCFPAANKNPEGATNKFSTFSINEMKAVGCY